VIPCHICETAEAELDAIHDDRKVRVCLACFLYETQGASVVPNFGTDIEVVRDGASLFQGSHDLTVEWAALGCPSDAQEYEELKAAKRGYWS
jgi:hypothetical protein